MPSPNPLFQPTHQGNLPTTLWIAILAIFSAIGIVLRQLAIPTFSPYVTLTPGFLIPLIAGIVLGPVGGFLCGLFVGISGALWEPSLIPLLGNVALGMSTGIPTYYRHKLHQTPWMVACIISAIIIGGFLPTFTIEVLVFGVLPIIAALTASIDAVQAGIWVAVALLLTQGIIEPILSKYWKTNSIPE
ncbi:MAG: ECF transporter S component [Promethearchaeota archaeon]